MNWSSYWPYSYWPYLYHLCIWWSGA